MKPIARLLVPALLASYLTCAAARAADFQWSDPAGGQWDDPGNWDPSGLPGAGDTATIPDDTAAIIIDSDVSVGRLTIGAGASVSTTTGTMLTLADGMELSGQLTNAGTVIWQNGEMNLLNSEITNQAGGVFDIQCDQTMGNNDGTPQFHNAGILRKSAGAAGYATNINVLLDNTGTVEVLNGTLNLSGGGKLSATLQAAGGASLYLVSGNFELAGTQHFQGEGEVGVNGNLVLTGALTGALVLHGGSLDSDSSLTVASGGVLTIESAMTLLGPLTVASGATLHIGATLNLGSPLTNAGTLNWLNGNLNVSNDTGAGTNGGITNQSGGLIDISCDRTMAKIAGVPQFLNAGVVRKTLGTGITNIQASFSNTGTVEALAGTLRFAGGVAQHTGTTLTGGIWHLSNDAIVNFVLGSNITLNQATVTLDGAACSFDRFTTDLSENQGAFTLNNGHTLTSQGSLTNSGALRVEGAGTSLTLQGAYTQTAGSTLVTGGAIFSATKVVHSGGTVTGTITIPPPVILTNVIVTPAGPATKARFSGTVSGGPPGGTATLQASSDFGLTDPWEDIATLPLDGSGAAVFPTSEDPHSTGLARDFFRVRTP